MYLSLFVLIFIPYYTSKYNIYLYDLWIVYYEYGIPEQTRENVNTNNPNSYNNRNLNIILSYIWIFYLVNNRPIVLYSNTITTKNKRKSSSKSKRKDPEPNLEMSSNDEVIKFHF